MVTTRAPSRHTSPGPYIDAVSAALMFADPTYQRDLGEARVQTMADEFDPRLVGVLEVSAREDGRYAILDGQHRWAANCRAHVSGGDAHLACQIHIVIAPPPSFGSCGHGVQVGSSVCSRCSQGVTFTRPPLIPTRAGRSARLACPFCGASDWGREQLL